MLTTFLNTCSILNRQCCYGPLNGWRFHQNHSANIQTLPIFTVQFHSLSCAFWTSEGHSRAGGRTYSVREVSRAGYLFCFVHQSAIAIALQETRSWTYAVKLHWPETNKGPQHVWIWVQLAVVAYIVEVSTCSENNTRCWLPIMQVRGREEDSSILLEAWSLK
jgi:hypothetical protein